MTGRQLKQMAVTAAGQVAATHIHIFLPGGSAPHQLGCILGSKPQPGPAASRAAHLPVC